MISTIIAVTVTISALWVYLDATKNNIGKIEDAKGMFNMSAGAWGIVTLLLWIIGFPAYLAKRGDLIEKAKANPVSATGRTAKAAAFGIVGGLWVFMTLGGVVLSALPACDGTATKSLIGQIVNDMPIVQAAGAQFVSLKGIAEQGYNESTQVRACNATLVTTAGENNLQYHVKWLNKQTGEFYVEAQIR